MKKPFQASWLNIANLLSILRLLLLPIFLWLAYQYSLDPNLNFLSLLLLLLLFGALTDFFDGYLARHLKQETRLGRYLDPICDKIVGISIFSLLSLNFYFPLWAYGFYLLRELVSIGTGTFFHFRHKLQAMPNFLGKIAVSLSVPLVAWYLTLPLLSMEGEAGDWLLNPLPLTYLWIGFLGGSMIFSGYKYRNVLFRVTPVFQSFGIWEKKKTKNERN